MPQLPDPNKYDDPIRFFRDCHALIITLINRLEKLAQEAESKGVKKSIKEDKDWGEILDFLVNDAPLHEQDEEEALFPIVLEKVPHIGFQQENSPMRFIQEQHQVMQLRSIDLLRIWKQTLAKNEISDEDAGKFILGVKELVGIYREHVRRENEIIYTTANDELLSPQEREEILGKIRELHGKQVISDYLPFDEPTFSLSGYAPVIVSGENEDAVSEQTVELEDDDEENEEEEQ